MRYAPALLAVIAACAAPALAGPSAPPETPVRPVTDTYHGVTVTDPYRWLEDWSDPAVKAWSDAQNEYARAYLDKLPHRDEIRRRLTALLSAPVTRWSDLHEAGGRLFARVNKPPKQQPYIAVMDSADAPGTARTVLDPETFDAAGSFSIDWYAPSPDGSLVAASLSRGGSESGDLYIIETDTGRRVGDVIERVNGGTAGGSLAWFPDGSGFYYARYPRAGERPEKDMLFYVDVYKHTIDSPPEDDTYEIGRDFPKIGEIELKTDNKTGRVICTVQDGDGGEFAHFVRRPGGRWDRVCGFKDGVTEAYFGESGAIYLISNADAPRGKVLRLDPEQPALENARLLIPESDGTIVSNFWGPQSLVEAGGRILVQYQVGGPSEIRIYDLEGNPIGKPETPPVSAVGQMTPTKAGVLFSLSTYTRPTSWMRYDPESGETAPTALHADAPADLTGVTVLREYATSKDGTKIPVNIMVPPGVTRTGDNPCILSGYGGYGISLTPYYSAARADLLEQGVIYAIANIRGGGEYGEAWHRAGNLTNKQNVFDDFQAAAEYLIKRRFTNHDKLALIGGSNGGLLMGATFTQRPDLARTVVSYVGIYDMLRTELSPNGVFNITEFGTVKDPEQFRALYAYSPYHHVVPGTDYPAVLFLTGANDPRVNPMQSRKMTAMLQAATRGLEHANPILLRTSSNTGHGGGTPLNERIEEAVDVHSFLYSRLGVDYSPVDD